MLDCLLGILKAGGAYVPIDPDYPSERISFMLEDSESAVLLTQEKLAETLPKCGARVVGVDQVFKKMAHRSKKNLPPRVGPQNLVYLIYTSGSTGKPKGVEIPHRALVNFLESMRQKPGLTDRDILLSVTTLSFDIAGLELYLPLIVGGRVELVSREAAADGSRLSEQLSSSGATIMQATPASWRLLLESGWQGSEELKILCGGEALSRELADQLISRCSSLWNMYGPTETTVWSALYRVESGNGPVPIGRPIANTLIYILDSHLRPVPVGIAGELLIGGDGLARGYLNRPELTAEKFIRNPFSDEPTARLYRTGDLARYLPDGSIEFLGRIDHQVKIRGFRIELGEIEAALGQHPSIRETTVLAREDVPGDIHLVAYIVAKQQEAPAVSELRSFLKQKIPDYMVPCAFVSLDRLPLTPNGKVNRRELPAPDQVRPEREESFVPPRDSLEQQLVKIWEILLGIKPIGLRNNFFELGGHSLLAVRLLAQIEKTFGTQLPLATVFEAPTIEQLASILRLGERLPPRSFLVPLQTGGSRPPFFCLHATSALAAHFGPNQPFYSLRAHGQDGRQAVSSVEEMAADYISEIRALQPEGPYFLGGYSFGGMVAFEVAQQLHKQGQELALVVLLDPTRPRNGKSLSSVRASSPNLLGTNRPFVVKYLMHIYNLKLLGPKEKLRSVLERLDSSIRRINRWAKMLVCRFYLRMGRRVPAVHRMFYFSEVSYKAAREYVPQVYSGRVTFLLSKKTFLSDRSSWAELVAGDSEFHELPGNHLDIIGGTQASVWSQHLRDCADNAQGIVSGKRIQSSPLSQSHNSYI
jgi:amino acid adenylation domain-containing protein